MVYFGIKTEFEAFQGEVIDFQENLNGVSLPHQVIKNGHGKILLAKKVTGRTSGDDIGKTMKVEPSRNGSYDRLIVFPVMEEEFLGQVRAVKTFSLGRNAFFVDLDIYQDEERFVHIAFRGR